MKYRYYAKEIRPGVWRIIDLQNFNLPIYGQDDKPLDFDEDAAMEEVDRLNHAPSHD